MGQIDKQDVLDVLLETNNPNKRAALEIYADAFMDYQEAAANITKNGNIVAHPRTGAPIENPYIKVKARAITTLTKLAKGLKTEPLWTAFAEDVDDDEENEAEAESG